MRETELVALAIKWKSKYLTDDDNVRSTNKTSKCNIFHQVTLTLLHFTVHLSDINMNFEATTTMMTMKSQHHANSNRVETDGIYCVPQPSNAHRLLIRCANNICLMVMIATSLAIQVELSLFFHHSIDTKKWTVEVYSEFICQTHVSIGTCIPSLQIYVCRMSTIYCSK